LAPGERGTDPDFLAREEIRTVDGLRIYSRTMGEGRDVVLVHGAGVSSRYWQPAQLALASMGRYRVHALDLPGFGRSETPRWPPDLPRLAAHLRSWLDAVGLARCDLVGQSLGCEVALLCAAAAPDRVEKLVLAAPCGLPALRSLLGQIAQAALDAPREPLRLYPVILPDYLRCGPARLLRVLREQKRPGMAALLRRVAHPTLVLRGARDTVVSAARIDEVARLLPDAVTATIPGAHAAHFSYPDSFARVVSAFLDSAEPSGGRYRQAECRCSATHR
jgi:pimeloyl-ACP methyl ester carboxylesterase